MKMFLFVVLCLCLGTADSSEWCYTDCAETPSHWANINGSFCGDHLQSPVNIIPADATTDESLGNFTFVNFNSQDAFHSILNNEHTIKVLLKENVVEFSGGGLNGTYSAIQFHFHWGDTDHHPGSEHLIDNHRFTMEMHVVSLKKRLTIDEALADEEGIAVLGFPISAVDNVSKSKHWTHLTSHLMNTTAPEVNLTEAISLNDLIGDVDLTRFFRYKGSLTTPLCNKVVVWTVFEEPIQVHTDLLQMFPAKSGITNAYRPTQELNGRHVYASPAVKLPPAHPWCYDEHQCEHSPSHWQDLAGSYCGGERQSPVDIDTHKTVVNKQLDHFTFTKFEDRHVIVNITNTGHAVKCILEEGLVEVTGGGLGHVYSVLQFHFHWGNTSVGSEHMVDSKQFPMEIHIVTKRKDLTLDEALKTGNGLAVLGFFVEAADASRSSGSHGSSDSSGSSDSHGSSGSSDTSGQTTTPSNTEAWKQLTDHLSEIQNISSMVQFTAEVSIDDLLGDVDRTSYYRYNGSLTTPSCNEVVVWTIFKNPIKVDHSLMLMFPSEIGYHDVHRPTQPLHSRTIYSTSSCTVFGPALLVLLLTPLCVFYRI